MSNWCDKRWHFYAVAVTLIIAGALCLALGMANVLDVEEKPSELREEDIPNVDSVEDCCQGLVAIDPVTSSVTIADFDIADYMRKHCDTLLSTNVKIKLARILLAYLQFDASQSGICCYAYDFDQGFED